MGLIVDGVGGLKDGEVGLGYAIGARPSEVRTVTSGLLEGAGGGNNSLRTLLGFGAGGGCGFDLGFSKMVITSSGLLEC